MLNKDQAITANEFHYKECVRIIGPRGGVTDEVVVYRRNGETKLWKTRPDEFRVPVKFGLRRCAYITQLDVRDWHTAGDCPLND